MMKIPAKMKLERKEKNIEFKHLKKNSKRNYIEK